MRLLSALTVGFCLAAASPAVAQLSTTAQAASIRRAPATRPRIGVRAYGLVEHEWLKATNSFNAVLGTSSLTFAGGGADVVNLWKGAFFRLDGARAKKSGTRVFLDGTTPISLDIPLTVTMTPIEIGGGWRFPPLDRGRHLVPYAGAARLILRYRETSQFADSGENTDDNFGGSAIFGGVDVAIRFVRVAVEGVYRHVPNALGAGGVSQGLNENNLGGGAIRLAVGIGF